MKLQAINSLNALNELTSKHERTFLLLYKSGSATSGCAESYLEETAAAAASITGVDRNLIDLAKEPAFWQAARGSWNWP